MHRLSIPFVVLGLALAGAVAFGARTGTVAQEQDVSEHPIVGAWLADTSVEDPANPPSLVIFHDDGTFLQTDPDGTSGIGTWEPTGPDTADFTILFLDAEEDEFVGTAKVRATVEVDAAGDAFAAEYTIEFTAADGASDGEVGPGTATAERIAVEEMGDPVASVEEAFGEEEATPEP